MSGVDSTPGSPDNQCQTCHGRGYYWEDPVGPFQGLITYVSRASTQSQPGTETDTDQGLIQNADPSLTIPVTASGAVSGATNAAWAGATLYDVFVEMDATTRFNASLQQGGLMALPYQQNVDVAASGAVTVYDPINHVVDVVSGYTVSGALVFLPSGYAPGTSYTVDFTASPAYVAFRDAGGAPHARPFGQLPEPRRFQLRSLDLWLRARFSNDIPTVNGGGFVP